MKGCPLTCWWCHNPESRSQEILKVNGKTIGQLYSAEELFGILIKDRIFYDQSGGGVTFSGGEPLTQLAFLEEILIRCRENDIQLVVGPATGGIILAFEVGRQMGKRAIFTEREEGAMQFRRGFSFEPGERILIVEDIVTTGGSVVEVIKAVEAWDGDLVGIGLLCTAAAARRTSATAQSRS